MMTRSHRWSHCWKAATLVASGLIAGCGNDNDMPPVISLSDGTASDASVDAFVKDASSHVLAPMDAGHDRDSGAFTSVDASNSTDASASDGGTNAVTEAPPVVISQNITEDTTWTSDQTYVLTGMVFVTSPATLTIKPGTVIKGTPYGALIIAAGAKLDAQGTQDEPIIFTSFHAEGERGRGDWLGIIMLGLATTNVGNTQFGPGNFSSQPLFSFGGSDDSYDCGKLRYVRIEWAGAPLEPAVDHTAPPPLAAGLSLAGCGSPTQVEYVQVHGARADGVEILGGVVSLKHVVVSGGGDVLHWDVGWRGRLQFLAGKLGGVTKYGLYGSNLANLSTAEPVSKPTLYNATLIGTKLNAYGFGIANGQGEVKNMLMEGFGNAAIEVLSPTATSALDADKMVVANSSFFDIGYGVNATDFFLPDTTINVDPNTGVVTIGNDNGWVEGDHFMQAKYQNVFGQDPGLSDPHNPLRGNWVPSAESHVDSNAATPPNDGFFDTSATYLGAFAPAGQDWTAGWTAYSVN